MRLLSSGWKDDSLCIDAASPPATCPPPASYSKVMCGRSILDDIYLATDTGKILKKLTSEPGYDAEATVNFKTKKIIYTSMASSDLDLWTMNLDGSGKNGSLQRKATMAARSFRMTGRSWCGARIILTPRKR